MIKFFFYIIFIEIYMFLKKSFLEVETDNQIVGNQLFKNKALNHDVKFLLYSFFYW